jgi:hypothetical protein
MPHSSEVLDASDSGARELGGEVQVLGFWLGWWLLRGFLRPFYAECGAAGVGLRRCDAVDALQDPREQVTAGFGLAVFQVAHDPVDCRVDASGGGDDLGDYQVVGWLGVGLASLEEEPFIGVALDLGDLAFLEVLRAGIDGSIENRRSIDIIDGALWLERVVSL